MNLSELSVEIYSDGADMETMVRQAEKPWVKGLTTNPSLMRKAGVTNYREFVEELVKRIPEKPVSVEVFAEDHAGMIRQAKLIHSLGTNLFVKIPITNSASVSSGPVIQELLKDGIKLNVTAIMTVDQVTSLTEFESHTPWIWSVFCGRISDTGRDPCNMICWCRRPARTSGAQILWASTRHVYNIVDAHDSGADIITIPSDILEKAEKMLGYDLTQLSLDTVQMFARDSVGYSL